MKMIKADYQKVVGWLDEPTISSEVRETDSVAEDNAKSRSENMKSEELYAKIKNVSIDEAIAACADLRAKISAKLPGSSPEAIEETLFLKLKTSGGEVKGDKADIVLVAVGPYVDKNFPKKQAALNLYKKDPEKALKEKSVRLDKSTSPATPVPIDSTEFYGNPPDPKRPNQNYLKDIGEDLKRDAIFLTSTGLCVQGTGKFDGEPGQIAHITGRVNTDESGIVTGIQVYKNGWKLDGSVDKKELWESTYAALAESSLSVPIEDIWDSEKYKMVAVMGRVSAATITKQGAGGAMIALTDIGLDEDVVGFADENNEFIKSQIDSIAKGMEVILFGTVNKYTAKDGTEKKNLNIIGCLVNPESSDLASALDKIADIDI